MPEQAEKKSPSVFGQGEGEMPSPSEMVGNLPISPPDPLGALLWHSENEGDLVIKDDNMLSEIEQGGLFEG